MLPLSVIREGGAPRFTYTEMFDVVVGLVERFNPTFKIEVYIGTHVGSMSDSFRCFLALNSRLQIICLHKARRKHFFYIVYYDHQSQVPTSC